MGPSLDAYHDKQCDSVKETTVIPGEDIIDEYRIKDNLERLFKVLHRRLDKLQERASLEQQKREASELSMTLMEDKVAFLDDSASRIVKILKRQLAALAKGSPDDSVSSNSELGESAMLVNGSPDAVEEAAAPPEDKTHVSTLGITEVLSVRERQLEQVMAQLNEANHCLLHQQTQVERAAEATKRVQDFCNQLLVELTQQRRITRDLERRVWQYDLLSSSRHRSRLLSTAVSPTVPALPERYAESSLQGTPASPPGSLFPRTQQSSANEKNPRYSSVAHLIAEWHASTHTIIQALDDWDNEDLSAQLTP